MAVGKLEYKKCTKCGREFPASTEYFYFNKSRVIKHFKHFMTVQTRHYLTSISYVDILIGAVKIK